MKLRNQTVSALLEARDALSNAINWLDSMHPSRLRVERRTLYVRAHAKVIEELVAAGVLKVGST